MRVDANVDEYIDANSNDANNDSNVTTAQARSMANQGNGSPPPALEIKKVIASTSISSLKNKFYKKKQNSFKFLPGSHLSKL